MQITQINFDPTTHDPGDLTMRLTVEQAAQLIEHCGTLTGRTGNAATSQLYDVLNQKVFLPYWDEGVDDYRAE